MRRLLLALALLAVAAPAAAARPAMPALPLLRAVPDAQRGGRIVDTLGRQVTLRGVNVNALAEYWRGGRFPTVFALGRRDPAVMASIGWNTVRLLLSWSRVEPSPGHYDERYLNTVARTITALRRAGLYALVDMHQDAWGPAMAARAGEVCPPPMQASLGWDGAPGWATLDGGMPHCFTSVREIDPAAHQSWQAFLYDATGPGGVGVQTRYVRMWGHVARRLARSTAVAGFDLMNEPNTLGTADDQRLSAMYARAAAAIRAGERASRGVRHIVFFEPSVLWSATGRGAPPDFSHDRDVAYAPHIYTGGFDNKPITPQAFETARNEARGFGGAPVLSGEWGGDPARAAPGGDSYFLDHQRLQDEFGFGATLWSWRESCGDPHKVGDERAGRTPTVWGEWDVSCRDNVPRGLRRPLVRQLTRGYVRGAPGALERTAWNPAARRLTAAGHGRARGALVAFFPGRRPRVTAHGLRRVRVLEGPGGGRLVTGRSRGGRWSLDVR